jgi:hypothetical protein
MPQIAGRAGFRRLVARVGVEQAFERLAKALACRAPTSLEASTTALLTQLGHPPGHDYLTQQVGRKACCTPRGGRRYRCLRNRAVVGFDDIA